MFSWTVPTRALPLEIWMMMVGLPAILQIKTLTFLLLSHSQKILDYTVRLTGLTVVFVNDDIVK